MCLLFEDFDAMARSKRCGATQAAGDGAGQGRRRILFAGLVLTLSVWFFVGVDARAAELGGQILYLNGAPARFVRIVVDEQFEISTDSSGFYSVQLNPGEHTLMIGAQVWRVFISETGTRFDTRIPLP